MTDALVSIDRLDHVHLYVKNRPAAVEWYRRVLNLRPFGRWRNDNPPPDHPIFLAPATSDDHCVSIFVGDRPTGGDRTVAFRATAAEFVRFASVLPQDDVLGFDGAALTAGSHHDYGLAITFSLLDPAGNHLEIVTYDTDEARSGLEGMA